MGQNLDHIEDLTEQHIQIQSEPGLRDSKIDEFQIIFSCRKKYS